MIFARIGSGPCYKHCKEICAGVDISLFTARKHIIQNRKRNIRLCRTGIPADCCKKERLYPKKKFSAVVYYSSSHFFSAMAVVVWSIDWHL